MPTYISLISLTDQGIRSVKVALKRQEAGRKVLKDMGGELKEIYATLGSYDIVAIAEAPDDKVMAKFLLSVGAAGNIRTTTMRAFTGTEFRKIIEELP